LRYTNVHIITIIIIQFIELMIAIAHTVLSSPNSVQYNPPLFESLICSYCQRPLLMSVLSQHAGILSLTTGDILADQVQIVIVDLHVICVRAYTFHIFHVDPVSSFYVTLLMYR